jgi:gamma-glutamyltranspeptidase/glutathione hydrolase
MQACLKPTNLIATLALTYCGAVFAASQAPAAGEHGMVVSAQHLATHVGVDILKKGGNAVDAAVAVGYALAVTFPAAGNLGGGGFMTIQLADGRKTFIDFREKAPLAATANMYLDAKGNVIPNLSTDGYLAVGVPGTVAGMEMALTKYGTMKRAQVIAPAITLADKGFTLDEWDANILGYATDAFRKDAPSAAIFLNKGQPFKQGETLVQKDLAHTLRLISDHGVDGFYKGPVASALVAASTAGKGIITQADLDQYRARELRPVECDYRGFHVVSAPPPSSGGVIICEILNIVEAYPLKELGWGSTQAVHDEIEAMRHAYADRNTYLGDPDFVKNPVDQLTDRTYAAKIRASIDPAQAGDSHKIRGGIEIHEGNNTTHYSIIDDAGNAVSVTYTLNSGFGARVTAAKTGVILNNEMDDFTVKVGTANQFGLMQGEANAIAPGKRPLSSMSPTIISRDGKPVMVVGSPGGARIITAVLHTIWNYIDYGMDVQEAVDAPRFHQQWLPDTTLFEPYALSPDTQKNLAAMGHQLGGEPKTNEVAAIVVGAPKLDGKPRDTNKYYGAIDPRPRTGLALGY